MTAPERTALQRLDALTIANDVRTRRAQLKRDLHAGRARPEQIISDPPDWADTMKVFDVLLAVPKYGRVKTNKLLNTCRVSPSKTLGGISDRQRREIVGMLRGIRPTRPAPARRAMPFVVAGGGRGDA